MSLTYICLMKTEPTFQWDDAKAEANEAKHGIPFVFAMHVFRDESSVDEVDTRKNYGEERRNIMLFTVLQLRLLIRCATEISASFPPVIPAKGRKKNMATVRKTFADVKSALPKLSEKVKARLAAMSEEEIEANALSDPDNQPMTDEQLDRAVFAREIRRIRNRHNWSQSQLAQMLQISTGTLQGWEQGRRQPDAIAKAFLKVVDREPEAVARALS
jgi:putative transcriptional regulator